MVRDVVVRRGGQVVGHARVCGQDDIFPPRLLPAQHADYEEEGIMDQNKHKAALDAINAEPVLKKQEAALKAICEDFVKNGAF